MVLVAKGLAGRSVSGPKSKTVPLTAQPELEWLCANRGGSFAMGTVDRLPRRKYHGLLTMREPEVGEPLNILAEVEEWFSIGDDSYALQPYDWGRPMDLPASPYLVDFDPSPGWTYRFSGLTVRRELSLESATDAVWLHYAVEGIREPVELQLRPMLRCRPWHKLTVANPFLNGEVRIAEGPGREARMQPYAQGPELVMSLHGTQGSFEQDGNWYQGVHYPVERERGYDAQEDLFTPGAFRVRLKKDARFALRLGTQSLSGPQRIARETDKRPRSFTKQLEKAAEAYLVELRGGRTGIIAGYPWFGEWSRDALISLPGLCLERGKIDEAIDVLESLVDRIEKGGLVPNIPRSGTVPANFDSIDASLLFVHATRLTTERARKKDQQERMTSLQGTCCDLLDRIGDGADARVSLDAQGFLYVEPGPWALTWMDALVEGQPVTPRHGYAVDLNAMWLSGLRSCLDWAGGSRPRFIKRWSGVAETLAQQFESRFWIEDEGYFTDTCSAGGPDKQLRPNQLWALTLPGVPLKPAAKKSALNAIRKELLTPVGLRTLSPRDPAYQARYQGDQPSRDRAYHQGTVWPWLLGLYAEAVVHIEGQASARQELEPVLSALETHFRSEACIGQISEVFDGDAPHRCGGAPAQAWSVAELLRAAKLVSP